MRKKRSILFYIYSILSLLTSSFVLAMPVELVLIPVIGTNANEKKVARHINSLLQKKLAITDSISIRHFQSVEMVQNGFAHFKPEACQHRNCFQRFLQENNISKLLYGTCTCSEMLCSLELLFLNEDRAPFSYHQRISFTAVQDLADLDDKQMDEFLGRMIGYIQYGWSWRKADQQLPADGFPEVANRPITPKPFWQSAWFWTPVFFFTGGVSLILIEAVQ